MQLCLTTARKRGRRSVLPFVFISRATKRAASGKNSFRKHVSRERRAGEKLLSREDEGRSRKTVWQKLGTFGFQQLRVEFRVNFSAYREMKPIRLSVARNLARVPPPPPLPLLFHAAVDFYPGRFIIYLRTNALIQRRWILNHRRLKLANYSGEVAGGFYRDTVKGCNANSFQTPRSF